MRLNPAPVLFLAFSMAAFADHSCIEELSNGITIKRERRLPQQWFRFGGRSVIDPEAHVALKKQYDRQYVSGFEEGEYGYLCLSDNGTYVAITTNDFGVGVEYSQVAPECLKCNALGKLGKRFLSGSGLHLGQTKAQVSSVVNAPVTSDIVSVTFEETVTEPAGKVWHTEVLRLEFENDALIRFSVSDYREGA